MPNLPSAKKELRKAKKRHVYNKAIKDKLKKLIKTSRQAIEKKDEKARELIRDTMKSLDKAAQKGLIKPNTRDRKKSRLNRKLNAASKS
jgi:small subunit ribosomal protein S20